MIKRAVCWAIVGGLLIWLAGCATYSALSGGSVPIGDIDGNVYQSTRATAAGIPVELYAASGQLLQRTVSGPGGYFSFTDVPVGVVTVVAGEGAHRG